VYQRTMMDAANDSIHDTVVYVTGAQVGKTTTVVAALGYYAETEPSPVLAIFPTQDRADSEYKELIAPTIDASPALKEIFDRLSYPGGYIAMVGANNPRQLASRPIRVIVGDEVDLWSISAGQDGSPIALAEKRTTTFRNRKQIYASTPRVAKTSQIVALFKQTKQQYYLVPCPDCGHKQVLRWENVLYTKGKEHDAHYTCEECGCLWDEAKKRKAVREAPENGGGWSWLREAPFDCFKTTLAPEPNKIGFWINAIYSPWVTMAKLARQWTRAEGDAALEQTFKNLELGLPWEGCVTDTADAEALKQRREHYSPKLCPKNAGLVTAGVDVQGDRIEVLTQAWGLEAESWLLEHIVIAQDPSIPATWDRLAEALSRLYPHEAGKRMLSVEAVAIDTGGAFTQEAYKFCAKWQKSGRQWHGIKGVSGEGKPLWRISDEMKRQGVRLALVGVDDGKSTVYSRYAIQQQGPGYIHVNDGISDEFISQMTIEHAEVEYDGNGFPKRTWNKKAGARNEGLDLMVYNLAARSSLSIDMRTRLLALNEQLPATLDPAKVGELFK